MSRTASEGLALVTEKENKISIIEINSETDFVAKNKDFISFCKELSEINFSILGNLDKLNDVKMKNGTPVKDSLISLIAKIGEKITIRRTNFFDNKKGLNFFYVHSAIENNIGKIISIVKLDGIVKGKNEDIGNKIAMHIAASNPLAIEKEGIKNEIINKELEIIKAEIINSGKPSDMAEKISKGKITKFINDNTLLNQIWIMDPKKKVSDILKENKIEKDVKVLDFIRYKVGEGI
jgi:translation elongation factor Ts